MKSLKSISFLLLLIITIFSISNCQKDNTGPAKINKLTVISNSSLANSTNGLQAVYQNSKNNLMMYYYGSFDVNGKPAKLKEAVIKQNTGDTVMNVFFDDSLRVKLEYASVGSIKDSVVMMFDYSLRDTLRLYTCTYNWSLNTFKIKNKSVLKKSGAGYSLVGLNNVKLSENRFKSASMGSDAVDDFIITFGIASAGIVVANAVIVAGSFTIGALLCGPICAVALEVKAMQYVLTTDIKAAETSKNSTYSENIPESPSSQTQSSNIAQVLNKKFITVTFFNSDDGNCTSKGHSLDWDIDGEFAFTLSSGSSRTYDLLEGSHSIYASDHIINWTGGGQYNIDEVHNTWWAGCSDGTHPGKSGAKSNDEVYGNPITGN